MAIRHYIRTATAKGLESRVVVVRHALRNALIPVITVVGLDFGSYLTGSILTETVFSWPGLGLATYQALQGPDLPMLQGLFLVFSAAVIVFNLLADLLYAKLDPRVVTA